MKNLVSFFAVVIGFLGVSNHQTLAATKPPIQGGTIPAIQLIAPENSADRSYLGLPEGERFSIHQVRAKVVIVELFSMY